MKNEKCRTEIKFWSGRRPVGRNSNRPSQRAVLLLLELFIFHSSFFNFHFSVTCPLTTFSSATTTSVICSGSRYFFAIAVTCSGVTACTRSTYFDR